MKTISSRGSRRVKRAAMELSQLKITSKKRREGEWELSILKWILFIWKDSVKSYSPATLTKPWLRRAEQRSKFVFFAFCSLPRFSLIAQEARAEWKTLLKIAKITQLYLCNDPDFCPTWGVHNNSYLHIRVNNSWRGKLIVNQPEL